MFGVSRRVLQMGELPCDLLKRQDAPQVAALARPDSLMFRAAGVLCDPGRGDMRGDIAEQCPAPLQNSMPGAIVASTKPDTTTPRRTLAPARGRGRTTHRGDGREIFSPHWPTPTSLVSRWACYAARAVGSIPLMSGGLLVVEAVLVPGLVSGGMTLASAISAMLIYRLISWIFIAAIGWVVFFFMFRTEKDGDPDAALQDEDAEIGDPPQFRPDPEAPHEPEP